MKKARYVGVREELKDMTAIVSTSGERAHGKIVPEGMVMIQMDEFSSKYSHGWHEFDAGDWEILPEINWSTP